jgi:hypothetical protein
MAAFCGPSCAYAGGGPTIGREFVEWHKRSKRRIVQLMQPKHAPTRDPDKPTSPSHDEVREPRVPGEENKEERFPRKGDLIDPASPGQDPK